MSKVHSASALSGQLARSSPGLADTLDLESVPMPRTRTPYPPEFREQIVALARAGRSVEDLAREFEPCAHTIHTWIRQADRDRGRRSDGLSSEEREELRHVRCENRQLRQERDILSKAAAWSSRRAARRPLGLRIHDGEPGHVPDPDDVQAFSRLACRLLCLARTRAEPSRPIGQDLTSKNRQSSLLKSET